jgi:5'(3')-deoxyribonucleotidase
MFRVLLDMDGVLVDFVGGICAAHGRENPYLKGATGWNTDKALGISEEEFWRPAENPGFWERLEWMPDGRRILDYVIGTIGKQNVYILTSPARSDDDGQDEAECHYGKLLWLYRELPSFARKGRLLFGSCKHLCAAKGNILVDDADHNVEAFRAAGGTAVLVPRPWNARHTEKDDAAGLVQRELWEVTE